MTTPPDDPGLPSRMRASAFIRDAERRMQRAWFRSVTRWMDRVRPTVTGGGQIQPSNVGQHTAFWGQLMAEEILPQSASLFARVRNRITGRAEPVTDPDAARFLNEAGNRLVRLPDEVYALIVREVEEGIARGEPIPDITQRINTVLTATGSERWPNRAVTVARTEVMAAVNAGAYAGAVRDAARRGDPAPFKVWLSTEDARTRPTHVEADGQRTLLTSPFIVGPTRAQLQFPGDPNGPAEEVIACRCSLLPIVLGETLDWTSRADP